MCSLSHSDRPTKGLSLTRHVITSYFFSLFCFFLFFWTISCECISLLCALCRTFSLIRRNTLSRARFHTFKESESNTYCGNLYFHWYVRAVFAMLISVSVQLAVERQLFFSLLSFVVVSIDCTHSFIVLSKHEQNKSPIQKCSFYRSFVKPEPIDLRNSFFDATRALFIILASTAICVNNKTVSYIGFVCSF